MLSPILFIILTRNLQEILEHMIFNLDPTCNFDDELFDTDCSYHVELVLKFLLVTAIIHSYITFRQDL